MSFALSLLVVALTGFISLSYEVVWFRAYSFASRSSPAAFGVLLGFFLLGLAFGSLLSRRWCRERAPGGASRELRALAVFLILATFAGFLVVPVLSRALFWVSWPYTLPMVALAAGTLGATLPLAAHFGIPPDARAGQRLSYLYVSNIVGSAGGSLLTGFVLLEHFTLAQITIGLTLLGLVLTAGLLVAARLPRRSLAMGLGTVLLLGGGVFAGGGLIFDQLWERMQLRGQFTPDTRFAYIQENRHGVVTVGTDLTVYGGGAYDGVLTVDLVDDVNWLVRPYSLPAWHPDPKNILVVGLAGGAWTQVLAQMPGVESVTAVEINPGYLDLIGRYAPVKSLLSNPKVKVVIDDGRRWLNRHPEQRFDAIVQNTTWHWRSNMSGLLSREYLELCRAHLAPGGVLMVNTTFSHEAMRTGAEVFPYAWRFWNVMILSDSPIVFDGPRWREALTAWRIDGAPVFDLSLPRHQARLDEVVALGTDVDTPEFEKQSVESREHLLARTAHLDVVTDDNMISEFINIKWW